MKYFLMLFPFVAIIFSTFSFAGGAVDCSNFAESIHGLDKFVCKLKDLKTGSKKLDVTFPGIVATNETDLLCVTKFYEVTFNGVKVEITGTVMSDDECQGGKRCRVALGLRTNGSDLQVAYSNGSSKVGALNQDVKLSCIIK